MEWLLILGLFVWAILLHQRLSRLEKRLFAQEALLKGQREGAKPDKAQPAAAAPAPVALEAPSAPEVPAAARDLEIGSVDASPAPPRKAAPAPKPAPEAAKAPPKSASEDQEGTIASWLSENGLAWIGGGALTLGGLLLVAYAAQRGFFTPGMRLAAAMALGFGLIGVSEWIRRKGVGDGRQHRLAAAVTAGAGAATLYGAVLAAHAVYHYIDVTTATALLALVSLGLLGLSFLHGEPLGLLALGGGYAAPLVGLGPGWEQPILFAYLILVTVTGASVSIRREWTAAMVLTVVAAGIWASARAFSGEHLGPALLALTPAALGLARGLSGQGPPARTGEAWNMPAVLPLAAGVAMPSIVLLVLWLSWPRGADLDVAAAASVALAAMAAVAVRQRLAPSLLYAGAAGSAFLGFLVLITRDAGWNASIETAAACVAVSLLVAAAGLFAVRRSDDGSVTAIAAALPTVVVVALLAQALPGERGWATAFAGVAAAALAGGAASLSRSAADVRRDLELGVWVAAAAMALFVALQAGADARVLPIAYAITAAGISLLARRLGWSAMSGAAMASGVLALAAMLNPVFATAVLEGDLSSLELAGVTAATAGVLAAGWAVVRRREELLNAAEALGTAALAAGLIGAFWLLQQWSQGRGAPLDQFTEASLRTLLLLLAGLAVISPAGRASGFIGRWRTHGFLIAGVVHAVLFQVLAFNPLWDLDSQARGWPVANTLLLAFLAPAAVLAFAVARTLRGGRGWRGPYALAGFAFACLWLALEIRRLFHGPDMIGGALPVHWSEAAAYGLAVLLVVQAVLRFAHWLDARDGHPRAREQVRALGHGGAWAGLGLSLVVFGVAASPWWGPIGGRPSGAAAVGLFALYAAGAAAAAWLAWPAAARGWKRLRSTAIAIALIQLFVLITLLIRWLYQGDDMRRPMPEASLQTWTYSAVWAVYGVLVLTGGMARRNLPVRWVGLGILLLTTAKVFLFDMAMLEGVIRAASFLALGALLIGGALISRRLRAVAGLDFGRTKDEASTP